MDYPIWEVPYLGGSTVIAVIAIAHVFIAHFAIGAGIFNALTETFALKNNNGTLRDFLRAHSKFIILLPFIGGVVTGVGTWFSIALVSPEATGILIHLFLWAWAAEWVFFLTQIIAGYVYYYTWDRLSPCRHCFVGWIYAVAAFLSLVLINGILTFMLSPGETLDSAVRPMRFDFWPGLFNPTYWPSLVLRTISALAIVALFVMVLVNASKRYNQQQRDMITHHAGKFLIPLILMIPAAWWFFVKCPPQTVSYLKGGAIAIMLLFAFGGVASTLIGLYAYGFIIGRRRSVSLETAGLLLAIGLIATGSAEFVREGMRKPYLLWGHLYSNGMLKNEITAMETQLEAMDRAEATVLTFFPWAVQPNDADLSDEAFLGLAIQDLAKSKKDYPQLMIRGRWIYDGQCLRCHAIDGYNGVRPLVHKWSPTLINRTLRNLEEIKPCMPPFVGTIRDRSDLTYYLHGLNGTCAKCHENVDDQGNVLDEEQEVTLKEDWEDAP